MTKIKLNLDKNKRYVLACSFGPDSMSLLNAALNEKLDFVVAHVNYRKREASEFEQLSLQKFCEERKIKLCVLDLKGVEHKNNFQAWARKVRYEFFKDVLIKEGAEAVLVAHQEDDVIETYLMQKNRKNFVKSWGISEENEIFGVKVIRPLLQYSKRKLQQYDDDNKVPYSIDESNLTDHYSRNKIRHSVVEKLTEVQRKSLLDEIKNSSVSDVEKKTTYKFEEFMNFKYEQIISLLAFYMEKTKAHRDLSKKFIEEIRKAFKTKSTLRIELTDSIWLEKDYEYIYLVNAKKVKPYKNVFKQKFDSSFISIDFSAGAEDRGITNSEQEFMIKNLSKSDNYIIKDYSSKVSRLFIDWKMPLFLREVWPGIYDKNMKLIYIPRYRENFVENHKSKFKINTEYFLEF